MSLKAQARNRLLILLAIVVLVAGSAGGFLGYRYLHKQRLYAQFRANGLAASKAGNDADVVANLGVYLRRYPDDLEALVAYAHSRPKVLTVRPETALSESIVAMRSVLRLDPTRDDDRRTLMKEFFQLRYLTEANEQADSLLERQPGDPEAMNVKISALIGLHRYSDALVVATARVQKDPTDWLAQLNQLQCLAQLGRPAADILKASDAAVQGHDNEQGAQLVRAIAFRLTSDFSNAQASLRAAAALPCTDKIIGFYLIDQLDELALHADSTKLLAELVKTNDPQARRMWLARLWQDGLYAQAADLCAGPASDLRDDDSLGMYADSLRRLGKDDQAAQVRATLAARPHEELVAAAWLAVEKALAQPGTETNLAARNACQAATSGERNDPYILFYQGYYEQAMGENNAAIDLWGKAAQYSISWALPMIERSQALLSEGRTDEAEGAAGQACRRAPNSTAAAIMLARVWFQQVQAGESNRAGKLNDLIDEIQKNIPDEEQTLQMRIWLLASNGQTDKAAATVRDLLAKQPPASQQMLMALSGISQRWNLGLEQKCLDAITSAYGRSPQSALAEAMDDYKNHKTADGMALLNSSMAAANATQRMGFEVAIASYLEMTADAGATKAWIALGNKYDHDLGVQRAVLSSKAAYQDRDFYDQTIERVRKLAGEQTNGWKLARARWLIDGTAMPQSASDAQKSKDAQTISDAQALLEDVLKTDPDSIPANLLMADIKVREGDSAGAQALLAKAQQLDPKSVNMTLDLAKMFQSRGDYDAARQQLEAASQEQNTTPQQREQTATMLAGQGDLDQAISIMEPLVADPLATEQMKLHLAGFYCRAKQFDKAQAICDELLKTPDAASIVLAAQLDMFRRDPDSAQKVLARLNDLKLPADQLEQSLGNFYYTFGRLDLALVHYRSATQPAPMDLPPWLSLINTQAAMGDSAGVTETVNEAIQHVADKEQLLAIRSRFDLLNHLGSSRTERQLLADVILDPSDNSPAVKVLQVAIPLETSGTDVNESLQKLQQLSLSLPRYVPAQTLLTEAQLHYGRCEDAIQSANRTAAAYPNDPWPAELATDALSATGRWDDALLMAKEWRNRIVGDPMAADLAIGEIQLRLRDPVGASKTVEPYLDVPHVTPQQQWQIHMLEARALVAQGKTDDAANLLWPTVQSTPAVRTGWLSFVVGFLPPADAEQWLHRLSTQLDAEPGSEAMQVVVAQTWNVLAQRSGNKSYAQLARQQATRLQSVPAAAADASFAMGTFLNDDGDTKGAEAAYRLALSKADVPDAENNLAELLADRNDFTEAADMARQLVKAHPTANFYDTLADVLGRAKQYDDALAAMKSALVLEPDNAKWHVHLAQLFVDSGKPDQAKLLLAELDLMTPGIRSLPDSYKRQLDALRRQLGGAAASATP